MDAADLSRIRRILFPTHPFSHLLDRARMFFPLSVLDLVAVGTGSTAVGALRDSLKLARLADRLGYAPCWFAEHHGMPSIVSSSPEILIAHVVAATERTRVSSGGMMLQNHVPLKLAEAFHTLEALHPGRIDLGVGRAPGTAPATSRALRPFDPAHFPEQLAEVRGLSRGYLPACHPCHAVRVIPAGVTLPPLWLLGSSGTSARARCRGRLPGTAVHRHPVRPPQPNRTGCRGGGSG